MNIIISAAAERMGGALTIYKQFLSHLPRYRRDNRYYIFVDESMPRPEIEGVEYIIVNLRNGFKRTLFDWYTCGHMLKQRGIEPHVAVSLQNTCMKNLGDIPQILYFHQSLPLYPNQWNPMKRSERTMAFYKYIYPFFIRFSLPNDVKVVVQTPFIKRVFCQKFRMPEEKVFVCFPDMEHIDTDEISPYQEWSNDDFHFVYPAIPAPYKRHDTILQALVILCKVSPELAKRIKVHFTFTPDRSPDIVRFIQEHKLQDMVCFEGHVSHQVLLSMYKASTALLFPSCIETIGLPLLEAASFGLNVIASDLDYAKEVIAPYEGAQLINNDDFTAWANAIINCAQKRNSHKPYKQSTESSWTTFFSLINTQQSYVSIQR